MLASPPDWWRRMAMNAVSSGKWPRYQPGGGQRATSHSTTSAAANAASRSARLRRGRLAGALNSPDDADRGGSRGLDRDRARSAREGDDGLRERRRFPADKAAVRGDVV